MGILRLFDLLDVCWILLFKFVYSYMVCALGLMLRRMHMIACQLQICLRAQHNRQTPPFCAYLSQCCVHVYMYVWMFIVQVHVWLYMYIVYDTCMHLLCSLQMGLMGPARLPDLLINTSHPPYSAPPTFSLSLPHRHKQKQNHDHPNITPNAHEINTKPKLHLNQRLPHIFKI